MVERFLKLLNALDAYIERADAEGTKRRLYERQFSAFKSLRAFINQGGRTGYFKLPTGVGKTVFYIEFLKATGARSLVVVPTNVLVEQTGSRINAFGDGIDHGKINRYAKEYHKTVTVITYASLIRRVATGAIKQQDYDVVILDEAHKALGEKTFGAVQQFTMPLILGFTATPDYSAEKELRDFLGEEIYALSPREAIEEGLLANCSVIIVRTNVDMSNVRIQAGVYREEDLDRALNVNIRNEAAVKVFLNLFAKQQALAYCVTVNHAVMLSHLFKEHGVRAEVISGRDSDTQREEKIRKFRSGALNVLCNADLLIEGFDDARASVCLNLRPTLSRVVAEQRAGRVLRFDAANPSKHAYVVDFLDRLPRWDIHPVTYAEILEGAQVTSRKTISDHGGAGAEKSIVEPSCIKGIEVIVDADKVMEIVRIFKGHEKLDAVWLSETQIRERIVSVLRHETGWRVFMQKTGWIETWCRRLPRLCRIHIEGIRRNEVIETPYFHIDLAAFILQEFKEAPSIWESLDRLAKRFAVSEPALKEICRHHINYDDAITLISQEHQERSEVFIPFWIRESRIKEDWLRGLLFCSPLLAEVVQTHIQQARLQYPVSSTGWVTTRDLKNYIRNTVFMKDILREGRVVPGKRLVGLFLDHTRSRVKYPHWFRDEEGEDGVRECYAPEFFVFLQNQLEREEIINLFRKESSPIKQERTANASLIPPIYNESYVQALAVLCARFSLPRPQYFLYPLQANRTINTHFRCECSVDDQRGQSLLRLAAEGNNAQKARQKAAKLVFTALVAKFT